MDTRAGDALDTQGLGMGPLVRNSTAKKVVSPHLLIKKNHPCRRRESRAKQDCVVLAVA